MQISDIFIGTPQEIPGKEEEICYNFLNGHNIEFKGVHHSQADTMEICKDVEKALGALICKNLFLCTRNKSNYYLLLMPGDKVFKTKDVTAQLGCSRLSFASGEDMQSMIGCAPGSASVLGLINDSENRVQLVIDRDLLKDEYFGCHPCKNTTSLKIKTSDLETVAKGTNHSIIYVELP